MKNSWLIILLLNTLVACHNPVVFEKTQDFEDGWHKDSLVTTTFQPKDLANTYNVYFLVRNDNTYPYANLFLIAEIDNGKQTSIDTLEYAMADEKGNWLGSGIWDLKESKLIYKQHYKFKDSLPVTFKVQQAVRKSGQVLGDDILPGIKTVGIIIEEDQK